MKEVTPEMEVVSHSLTPTEPVLYIEIIVPDPEGPSLVLRFTDAETHDWDGYTWVNSPFYLSEIEKKSTGERNRPKLNMPNENGAYSYYLAKELFNDAIVTRYVSQRGETSSVLTQKNVFYISHLVQIRGSLMTFELRYLSDGNRFRIPPRRYISPEFPTVIL